MKDLIGEPIVTYIRLKRVKPTKSKCIRLLRKLRTELLWEPVPFEEDGSLEDFFWLLHRKEVFFAENSTIRYTDFLTATGYSVSVERLQRHKKNEYSVATNYCLRGRPVFRIVRKLSIQGNEATTSFCLESRRQIPHASFLRRLINSEWRYQTGGFVPVG